LSAVILMVPTVIDVVTTLPAERVHCASVASSWSVEMLSSR